jgi:hypothetical protein
MATSTPKTTFSQPTSSLGRSIFVIGQTLLPRLVRAPSTSACCWSYRATEATSLSQARNKHLELPPNIAAGNDGRRDSVRHYRSLKNSSREIPAPSRMELSVFGLRLVALWHGTLIIPGLAGWR